MQFSRNCSLQDCVHIMLPSLRKKCIHYCIFRTMKIDDYFFSEYLFKIEAPSTLRRDYCIDKIIRNASQNEWRESLKVDQNVTVCQSTIY